MSNKEHTTPPKVGQSELTDGLCSMYSDKYNTAIEQAKTWFANRLPELPEIRMSRAEFNAGTDALTRKDLKELVAGCFTYMLEQHSYELSYSQQCRAFFGAAEAAGRIYVA